MNIKKGFVFAIDTNEYSGNFEREMCAYLTGCVGECEVGEEYVDKTITPIFSKVIKQCPDDHGCYRPCDAIENESGVCHSVGIFFSVKPTDEQIEVMKKRSFEFNQEMINKSSYNSGSKIEILGFRLLEIISNIKSHKI